MVLVADTHFGNVVGAPLTVTEAQALLDKFRLGFPEVDAFAKQQDRTQRFLAGARGRLMLAKRDRWLQERAYAEGKMDGRMVGRSAMQAARVLYFDSGEAAVCYMNGVGDATAGL